MTGTTCKFGALFLLATPLLGTPLHGQQFGAYVAISEGQIMIAEPTNPGRPSTIYTYAQSEDGWEQVGTMLAPLQMGLRTTSVGSL